MIVLIETPKFSFRKFRWTGDRFLVDFLSPLPTIFNYGIVEGTTSGDGLPIDVVVLGGKIRQGERLEVLQVGLVKFLDDGMVDDKIVASKKGVMKRCDVLNLHIFFTVYSIFKVVKGFFEEGELKKIRFLGFKRN